MSNIGDIERLTQNRIVKLFKQLGYSYLGDWEEREGNSNLEEALLTSYLTKKGYSSVLISKAIFDLKNTANNYTDDLYEVNKKVYKQLRFGVKIKEYAGKNNETVQLIDWKDWASNDFAIA